MLVLEVVRGYAEKSRTMMSIWQIQSNFILPMQWCNGCLLHQLILLLIDNQLGSLTEKYYIAPLKISGMLHVSSVDTVFKENKIFK